MIKGMLPISLGLPYFMWLPLLAGTPYLRIICLGEIGRCYVYIGNIKDNGKKQQQNAWQFLVFEQQKKAEAKCRPGDKHPKKRKKTHG
jgi:hypothetical protein